MRAFSAARLAAASGLRTVTRTISQPASSRRRTWAAVRSRSSVCSVVIDWTRMGLAPPRVQRPTATSRVGRRVPSRSATTALFMTGLQARGSSAARHRAIPCAAAAPAEVAAHQLLQPPHVQANLLIQVQDWERSLQADELVRPPLAEPNGGVDRFVLGERAAGHQVVDEVTGDGTLEDFPVEGVQVV